MFASPPRRTLHSRVCALSKIFNDTANANANERIYGAPRRRRIEQACGVCASDGLVVTGRLGGPYPAIPGHEAIGKVRSIATLGGGGAGGGGDGGGVLFVVMVMVVVVVVVLLLLLLSLSLLLLLWMLRCCAVLSTVL